MDTETVVVKSESSKYDLNPNKAPNSFDPVENLNIKPELPAATQITSSPKYEADTETVTIKPEPYEYGQSPDEASISFNTEENINIKHELLDNPQIYVKVEPYDERESLEWRQEQQPDIILPDDGSQVKIREGQEVEIIPLEFEDNLYETKLMKSDGPLLVETKPRQNFANKPPHVKSKTAKNNTCDICHKSFATNNTLQRHLVLHTRTTHECKICKKEFYKLDKLDKHLLIHNNKDEVLYPCEECGKKFRSSSNLMQHKRVHANVKPYFCEVCHRSFVNKGNLIKHQGKTRCKRPIDEPLICHVCHKEFQKEFLLRSHLRRHTTEKPYICDICGMEFKYKSTIIRHLQWHTGKKPYKCKYCNKDFTHLGLMKPHLRVHTGEKPYQCSICLKYFAHKHNMERHKINHGRIKRLVCDICNKKFPRESRLIYHMRTHTNIKFFVCHICDKRFSHKQNILRHYERKHPGFTYNGTETDAKVAIKVWDQVKHTMEPHFDMYQQPEQIF